MKSKKHIDVGKATIYIAAHYKEIRKEVEELSSSKNFAGILQALVNELRTLLEKGEFRKISCHIKYIGWIYQRGNKYIKYIVENLFVRSFEGIRRKCSQKQWQQLYVEIPESFKAIYLTQNNLIQKASL